MSQHNILLRSSRKQASTSEMLARFISDIANPLFIPPIVFSLVGWYSSLSINLWLGVLSTAVTFYTLIPLAITIVLLKKGYISSLDAPEQQSRNKLFGFAMISSAIGSLTLMYLLWNTYPFLSNTAIVFLINPFLGLLINLKWKISIHTASLAMASILILFFFITEMVLSVFVLACLSLILVLLLLVMIWARHHLKIHTPAELLGGTTTGIMLTSIELLIIL